MNLQTDDFELFALPRRFAQDTDVVAARWKALQRETHPDRFAAQGAAAQRVASQLSARVNEAHRRLSDPLARASYLCELRGAPVEAESNTAMPPAFLVEQLEWREALDDAVHAGDRTAVGALKTRLDQARAERLGAIERLLDHAQDATAAVAEVRALMFIERFAADVDARVARLGQ